jgi:polyisoprenoid-binding protein YceI
VPYNTHVMRIHTRLALIVFALTGAIGLRAAGPRTFAVQPEQSRALIDVGKSGAFSFAGHTHEVEAPITSGVVHLDADNPSRNDVRLEFNAAAMRVTGKGESADDVPKVTQTMVGEMVLDVRRYPAITFESTSVTAKGSAAALELSVTGRLTIRGKTQAVTAPVAVKLTGDRLTATGKMVVKQTDFGITPISVGGVVKVKNELNITFTIVALER